MGNWEKNKGCGISVCLCWRGDRDPRALPQHPVHVLPVELEKPEALSQVDSLGSNGGFTLPCPPWRDHSGSASFLFHMLVGTSPSLSFPPSSRCDQME